MHERFKRRNLYTHISNYTTKEYHNVNTGQNIKLVGEFSHFNEIASEFSLGLGVCK